MYRDLKSDNVMLVHDWAKIAVDKGLSDADNELVKIIDFGCSRTTSGDAKQVSSNVGHLWYIPPEGEQKGYDPEKLDVYRFGLFAFEVWTCTFLDDYGRDDAHGIARKQAVPATAAKPLRDAFIYTFHNAPTEVQVIIRRCWKHKPAERPSFAEICTELDKATLPAGTPEPKAGLYVILTRGNHHVH